MNMLGKQEKHISATAFFDYGRRVLSLAVFTYLLSQYAQADHQNQVRAVNISPTRVPYTATWTLEPSPTRSLTPTSEPTSTNTQTPSPTSTPDCEGYDPKPNLIVGGYGQSSNDGSALNLRSEPSKDSTPVGMLANGEIFKVLQGPVCGGSAAGGRWYWFKIQEPNGTIGWVANADHSGLIDGTHYEYPYIQPSQTPTPNQQVF